MASASPVRSPAKSAQVRRGAVRSDPVPKHVTGALSPFDLTLKDESKKYAWAYKGDQATGVDYYLNLGYEPVLWTEGGVRPGGRRGQVGTEIERMGMVLMQIDMETYREQVEFGVHGRGGMRFVEERAEALNRRPGRGLFEGIRGLRGGSGDPVVRISGSANELTRVAVEDSGEPDDASGASEDIDV